MNGPPLHLGDTTWPELVPAPDGAGRPVVALPLGSCEQHGPHLPLDTDTRLATAFATRLAAAREGVVVAPALAFGASWEHAGFPGLLSLDHELLAGVIVELARSADWADGIVLVNGHGGNHEGIRRATATLTYEGRRVLAWSPIVPGGDPHAGRTETSLLLALSPDAVRLDRFEPGASAEFADLRTRGVAAVSPNGILGDPRGASAGEGLELLARLAADLVAAFDRWRR